LAPSRKKRRAPPPPPPAYATVVLKEKEVKQVEEREELDERKEIEEEKKRLEKEERMRRDEVEEEERRKQSRRESEDIPVQVIQEPDNSEPAREDDADITREVFEVTHDAVMITDIEVQDTQRNDEKEEFKEKKKKKKKDKDKDRDQSGGEGGEERKRRKKKHKQHREESEGREERRKHRHHHRRREEGGEVEETERKVEESHLEKKDEDIGKSRDREDMQNRGMDEMRREASETERERNYLEGENCSGGRVEEVGVLQLEFEQPDDPVGTDVPAARERVEQNPIIAAAPTLSDSPGIERRPEHSLNESTNSGEMSEETLVNPMQSRDSDMVENHTEAVEEKIASSQVSSSQVEFEEEEEEEDDEARRKEETERRRKRSERRRSKREEKKERADEPIAKELPSFRGARAGHAPSVKESERENSLAVNDTDDSDDSLVNSDDELVDLFLSHKERLEAKKARQAKQSGSADGGLSTGPANQDLEAETVVKITGKQREEERKEEIRREQRKGRGRETDVQQQQQGSESVRKALTQLNLGGDEPPAYKREWKAVELDIVDEDIGLPSLSSTRSNSVTEMSSDEEGRRAVIEHNMFAMKELEKEVERQRSQPVNQALDEAFAKISLTGQHDSYVTVGNTQVVERQDRESPEPKIICETKNFHVRETPRDFDFSDTEDNSLSSHQSSLARGGEGSPDAVRHRQPREAPNVTRAGGEAPSPDSGIHDYTADQCASPVSSLGLCREEEAAAGPSTPDSGLELHGSVSEVTSSSGADVCLQDVAEEEEEEEEGEPQQTAIERVELPRRHTGKVLFSMASYNERGPSLAPTPAPRDVARTESYRRVSTQLNSNLAAGVERAKEAERREREEHERKAREERERRNLAEEEEQKKREKKEQQQKEVDQRRMKEVEERKWREEREQRRERAEEEDRQRLVAQQRRQREKEDEERRLAEELEARYRKKEGEAGVIRASSLGSKPSSSATFRSRIIEEFECRRGVVIVGGSMQQQGAGARMAGAPPRHSAQSTATGQDKRAAEAGGQQETRSLDRREMPSWGGQFSSLQRAPDSGAREAREPISLSTSRGRGPPSISMQVWGEEPRVGGVVVKEDRDTALGRRVSQPAATEEVVTSGGSTQSTGGQYKHRPQHQHQQPITAPPKAIEIRQRSGEAVESQMMENPRAAVVSAAKNSRGGDGDTVWGPRIQVSSQIFLPPPNCLFRSQHLMAEALWVPWPMGLSKVWRSTGLPAANRSTLV